MRTSGQGQGSNRSFGRPSPVQCLWEGDELSNSRFFAIDRQAWHAVCDLGMNEAVSYLIIAAGTGRDHRTSGWSATAVEKYTGMHHVRAKEAIAQLVKCEHLTVEAHGKLRRYKLLIPEAPEYIWLPLTIVEGANDERPPLKLLRKAQNLGALKLFIDLYFFHDLAGNGGCEWRVGAGMRLPYERSEVCSYGSYTIWRFTPVPGNNGGQKIEVFRDAKFAFPEFWDAFNLLLRAGLVDFVEHLVDGDTSAGEVLHPLPIGNKGEAGEREITAAALAAARRMIQWPIEMDAIVIPVEAIAPNVQLIGVARLLYKPHVKQTKAWFDQSREWANIVAGFDDLASGIKSVGDSGIKEGSRIYQG